MFKMFGMHRFFVLFMIPAAGFWGCLESNGKDMDADDDGGHDLADHAEGDGGCDQELPGITGLAQEFCNSQFLGSCLQSGCSECQVCYVDMSCLPRDRDDAPNCNCYGDGQCHRLCSSNSDCSEYEECVNLGWTNGTDIFPAACVMVCWPRYDTSVELCH